MVSAPGGPIRPVGRSRAGGAGQRIAPVPRESTVDLIAARLRQAIYDGTVPAGAPLGEAELAEQLGVSRGPLREAAQRLVQEQLLTTTRRRGLTVVTMAASDVSDLYLARGAVERAACRCLLQHDTTRILRTLTRIHQRMARASAKRDARAAGDADIDFHRALVDAAGSARLSRMMATLLVETRLCTYSLDGHPQDRTFRVRADMPDSHAAIIDALRNGDEATLLTTVDRHMDEAAQRLTASPDAADTIASPTPARRLGRLNLPASNS